MPSTLMLAAALLAAPAAEQAKPSAPAVVAAAVDSEFAAHDKNDDGKLSRAEFAEWIVALKTRSDPTARATSPKTRAWVAGAFALADRDKSAGVTRAELAGLLERARS